MTVSEFRSMSCAAALQPLFPENSLDAASLRSQSIQHIQIIDYPDMPAVRFHEAVLIRCLQDTDPQEQIGYVCLLAPKHPCIIVIHAPNIVRALPAPQLHSLSDACLNLKIPIFLSPSPNLYPKIVEQTLWNIWQDASHEDTGQELFLKKLKHGEYAHPEDLLANARKYGIREDGSWYCIVGSVRPVRPFLVTCGDSLHELTVHYGEELLQCIDGEKLVFLLAAQSLVPAEEYIGHFLDQADECIHRNTENTTISWAYDTSGAGLQKLDRRCRTATVTLQYGLSILKDGFRLRYEAVRRPLTYQYLYNNEDIQKICRQTLGQLYRYSEEKGIDLPGTLAVFFHNNYNVSQTAEDLHLHRQSLIYRLSKIEELCGISLHSHEDLFFLDLCLHVAGLNRSGGPAPS